MNAAPRPAARVLLAGRYLVPRVALLALPAGPVVGLDLTRGVPVTLRLVPALDGAARSVTTVDLSIERPVPPAPDPPPDARRTFRTVIAVRRELASRRARLTLLAGVVAAGVVVASSLLGGSHAPPRAAARAQPVRLPSTPAQAVRPVIRRARAHVAAVHRSSTSRGGPARVLVVAAPAPQPPAPAVRTARSAPHERAPSRTPGWVDGLVVGS